MLSCTHNPDAPLFIDYSSGFTQHNSNMCVKEPVPGDTRLYKKLSLANGGSNTLLGEELKKETVLKSAVKYMYSGNTAFHC